MSDEHNHSHVSETNKKTLIFSLIITFIFMVVELAGGFISGSLSLVSDAIHMLADSASLATALWAINFGMKKADEKHSFGFKRVEIVVGLINALILVVISFFILKEGVERLFHPTDINQNQLLIIAVIGLTVNIITAFIMYKGSKSSINMRGAFLHVIGDLLGSLGVIVAAIIIYFTGWLYADPLVSILISLIILSSAIKLIKESIHILMEGIPKNINTKVIIKRLLSLEKVSNIHDLHVWTLTESEILFTAHIVIEDGLVSDVKVIASEIKRILQDDFKIKHSTLEFETLNCDEDCELITI